MAALDFPDSPALEEEFGSEGLIWIWNGEQWIIKGGGAGGAGGGSGFTFSQDTAPLAVDVSEVGDTWFNTATGDSFVWTVDGDSQQWVQFAPGAGGGSGGGGGGGGSTEIEVGTKVGVISSWATDSPIPADCLVCDGQAIPADAAYDQLRALHGTNVPDLRDKFLLGASATKALRSVGGAETHVLTPGEMPSHTHIQDAHNHTQNAHVHDSVYNTAVSTTSPNGVYPGYGSSADAGWRPSQLVSVAATNIAATATNQYTGGNAAHNNMPPYYAVIFIIQAKPTLANVSATVVEGGAVTAGAGLVLTDNVMAVVAADGNLLVTEDAVQLNPNLSITNLTGSGTVQGAYVNSTGALNAAGTVSGAGASFAASGIYTSGDITTAASVNMTNGVAAGQIQMNTGRINGVGNMYPGCTIGGGNANFMGLTWVGNEVLGTIDNVVAASLGVGSDRRIKREIAEFTGGLDVVLALNPVTYKVRDFHVHEDGPITFTDADDDTIQVGLVADEVAWVAPWAVIGEANDPGQIQSVTYTKLVAPLIQAVQDQQAQIAALTARLEALEAGA